MGLLLDTVYMTVTEDDNGILVLCWKEQTAHLTDNLFKEQAQLFVSLVQKQNSRQILVDMRNFSYALSYEIITWRNENIISEYNRLNVKKFAFISNKPTVKQDDVRNSFVTRSFSREQEAKNWLLSSS